MTQPKWNSILFDLDGTLVDSDEPVLSSFEHACSELGVQPVEREFVRSLIGIPLREIFAKALSIDDEQQITELVAAYRVQYGKTGVYQHELFPGIEQLLRSLHDTGAALYVATAKTEQYARVVMDDVGVGELFSAIYGAMFDGTYSNKTELLARMLESEDIEPEKSVMIGDRATDVQAGATHGLATIGLTFGYGSREEIASSEPNYIAGSVDELSRALHS